MFDHGFNTHFVCYIFQFVFHLEVDVVGPLLLNASLLLVLMTDYSDWLVQVRDTVVPAEGNGDLQTLICVLVAWPRRCLSLSNPVPWQNWMAAYLGYTLRMNTLFHGWPVTVHDTQSRSLEFWRAPLQQTSTVHFLVCLISVGYWLCVFVPDWSNHDAVQGGAYGTCRDGMSTADTALRITVDWTTAHVCHRLHQHAIVCHRIAHGHVLLWPSPTGTALLSYYLLFHTYDDCCISNWSVIVVSVLLYIAAYRIDQLL